MDKNEFEKEIERLNKKCIEKTGNCLNFNILEDDFLTSFVFCGRKYPKERS